MGFRAGEKTACGLTMPRSFVIFFKRPSTGKKESLLQGVFITLGQRLTRFFQCLTVCVSITSVSLGADAVEEVTVIADQLFKDTSLVSPTSLISADWAGQTAKTVN